MSELDAVIELVLMLLEQPRILALIALLLTAALIDWRSYRIPNWLTGGGAVVALLLSIFAPTSPQMGFTFAISGLALGLALMLPLYLLGVMGAGDVKLMAMTGAFLGVPYTLHAVLFVFITGGVLALGTVLMRRALVPFLSNLKSILLMARVAPEAVVGSKGLLASMPSVGKLPYGVSICVGTLVYVFAHQLGYV